MPPGSEDGWPPSGSLAVVPASEVLVRCADAFARAGKASEACGVAARAVGLELMRRRRRVRAALRASRSRGSADPRRRAA